MKSSLYYLLSTCIVLSSCSSAEIQDGQQQVEKDDVLNIKEHVIEQDLVNPYRLTPEKCDSVSRDKEYYIVNYAGVETEEKAIALVDSLLPDFPESGYLWIPDFASLSGKEMYAVFVSQGAYKSPNMEFLQNNKQSISGIYVVKVNQSEERWAAYSPMDIRINGKKQKMILIYATPEDEDEYAEGGGEDWGWFVYDVQTYFGEHHPEVIFSSVFYNNLLPEEIDGLQEELDLEGFGYVLINGKEKQFIGHDMPESVISSACEFFGFKDSGVIIE